MNILFKNIENVLKYSNKHNYLDNLNKSKLDIFTIYQVLPTNTQVILFLNQARFYITLNLFESHVYLSTKLDNSFFPDGLVEKQYTDYSRFPKFSDYLLIDKKFTRVKKIDGVCLNSVNFIDNKTDCLASDPGNIWDNR